jgi:hypothetical protein
MGNSLMTLSENSMNLQQTQEKYSIADDADN